MTVIKKSDEDYILEAKKILENGGLVVFPTETVYGLGANAFDKVACKKIYEVKGRPSDNPLIIHIGDISQLNKIAKNISDDAKKIIGRFWPGPLTLIFDKTDIVPNSVTGGLETVAVRMPNHNTALNLLKKTEIALAAPSANISGRPSPTKASHVVNDLFGKVDMIIDDDSSEIGIESTILDLSEDEPRILRPGFITKNMIEEVLQKEVVYDACSTTKPKAPGMKYKHYSPMGELTILRGDLHSICNYINESTKADEVTVLLALESHKNIINKYNFKFIVLSYGENVEQACTNMYSLLRKCDELGAKKIYTIDFERNEIGYSIMNRLDKAAAFRVENLNEKK